MELISDQEWQKTYLQRFGTVYTSPSDVQEIFLRLTHAAEVSGRSDIANVLRCLDTRLLQQYAPILAVLSELVSSEWLEASIFSIQDVNLPQDQGEGYDMIREDSPIEDQWTFNASSPPSSPSLFSSSINDLMDASMASDTPSRLGTYPSKFDHVHPWKDGSPRQRIEQPVLSEAELLRELKFAMLGWDMNTFSHARGLTDKCFKSIMAEFRKYASLIDDLRGLETPAALSKLQSLERQISSSNPRSVLDALVQYRDLAVPLKGLSFLRGTEEKKYLYAISRWLDGYVSEIIREDLDVPVESAWEHRFTLVEDVPKELRHPKLLDAGKYAWFCRLIKLQPHSPIDNPILSDDPMLYRNQIYGRYQYNSQWLMGSETKKLLLDSWEILAGVYLAQDARTLESLYQNVLVPLPTVPLVVHNVFRKDDLNRCLHLVLKAFGKDVHTELNMRSKNANVRAKIQEATDLSSIRF